jgi:3-oxo-5alpha-steroid 4-dehydrogenase
MAASQRARVDTVTPILPALQVGHADELPWAESADVLVVGWGAAGASAAIEARAQGASVIVIDRFGGGGASALSGGVVYAGGGTAQQREAGQADSPQAMFDYLQHEVNGIVSDATLRRFCDDSVANLQWLEAQGVCFAASMPAHKTSYPPDGQFLYHSGNELVPACAGPHAPAARGHRAVSRGQSGAALFAALKAATLRAGAQGLTQASVRRLVRERGDGRRPGRVLGVEAWVLPAGDERTRRHAQLDGLIAQWRLYQPGKADAARQEQAAIEQAIARPRFLRAKRAVVLSTGGYVNNPALVQAHAPQYRRLRRQRPAPGPERGRRGARAGQRVGLALHHAAIGLAQGPGAEHARRTLLQRAGLWRQAGPRDG